MQKYVIALYIRLSLEDYKYDSIVAAVTMHSPASPKRNRFICAAIPQPI